MQGLGVELVPTDNYCTLFGFARNKPNQVHFVFSFKVNPPMRVSKLAEKNVLLDSFRRSSTQGTTSFCIIFPSCEQLMTEESKEMLSRDRKSVV